MSCATVWYGASGYLYLVLKVPSGTYATTYCRDMTCDVHDCARDFTWLFRRIRDGVEPDVSGWQFEHPACFNGTMDELADSIESDWRKVSIACTDWYDGEDEFSTFEANEEDDDVAQEFAEKVAELADVDDVDKSW